MNDIKQQIKDTMARISKKGDKLKVRHSFNLQGISKATIIEVIAELEYKYHIDFTSEDIDACKNLPALTKITIDKIDKLDEYLAMLSEEKNGNNCSIPQG